MTSLAAIGALIEVTPWDELQYWPNPDSSWEFIDDRTPFRFRVAGRLIDGGLFYGLQGPVEAGPERYLTLICSILMRHESADWDKASECSAAFRVSPSVARRNQSYDPAAHCDVPFFAHPEGTVVAGYPRISRFGGVRVIGTPVD